MNRYSEYLSRSLRAVLTLFFHYIFSPLSKNTVHFWAGSLEENFQIFSLSNKLERWKRCVLFKRMNKFKRGCQHPSHKFEKFLVSRPKFAFNLTFVFCSPICPNNCGVVFFVKIYFSSREMIFFVRPLKYANFTVNITRVVWPHVTNILDLQFFCQHNPLFYHLNLILFHYWSQQRNIYFLVNISVRHTFPMSKVTSKQRQF